MNFDFNIPLDKNSKVSVIESIFDAWNGDISDFRKDHPLVTNNSSPSLKWDYINTNIKGKLSDIRFDFFPVARGFWSFIIIFDKTTNFIYTVMRDDRFKKVIKNAKNRNVHYFDALTLVNSEFEDEFKEQLSLFEIDSNAEEYKEQLLLKMIKSIRNEVKGYALISFSVNKGDIAAVNAYIVSPNLKIQHEENWSDLISVNFASITSRANIKAIKEDSEDIDLIIRPSFIKSNNDIVPEIKSNDERKEKENI